MSSYQSLPFYKEGNTVLYSPVVNSDFHKPMKIALYWNTDMEQITWIPSSLLVSMTSIWLLLSTKNLSTTCIRHSLYTQTSLRQPFLCSVEYACRSGTDYHWKSNQKRKLSLPFWRRQCLVELWQVRYAFHKFHNSALFLWKRFLLHWIKMKDSN